MSFDCTTLTPSARDVSVRRMQRADQIHRGARRELARLFAATLATLMFADVARALEPDDRGGTHSTGASVTIDAFLDRLMMAESGGKDTAKNPLSTALGPFQFINATFLDVARRHFAAETANLTPAQILSLRIDRSFARRAAHIYTLENAGQLAAASIPTSYPNLRLAFLLGPAGAIRVLQSPGEAKVAALLGPAVIAANPFMRTMSAAALVARSARDVRMPVDGADGVASSASGAPRARLASVVLPALPAGAAPAGAKKPAAPKLNIQCNTDLASCRKWVALQTQMLQRKQKSPHVKAVALR